MVSRALPPAVVIGTSIAALARVGAKHTPFACPVITESAEDEDEDAPVVALAHPSVGEGDDDEEGEGSVLADYARVAASGSNNYVSAIAALPALAKVTAVHKHRVTERVLTLGELVAERARKRETRAATVNESVSGPSLAAAMLRLPR